MTTCPYCGSENIEGVDDCEACGQSLSDLHLETPLTDVEKSLLADRIAALQPNKPISIPAQTPVRDVLRLLVDKGIGCLIVVEGDKPVGIFSERDALLKLNTDASRLGDRPVSQYMTAEPETLEVTAKIAFAVHRMDLGGYRHIPVVSDEGALTGIISVRDILRYLAEKLTADASA